MKTSFSSRFPGFLFGGDYNPEQWTPPMGYTGETIWLDDIRLMRLAGVNTVSVGVFSWAALQPDEPTFTFDWLDRVLALLAENGIFACLRRPRPGPLRPRFLRRLARRHRTSLWLGTGLLHRHAPGGAVFGSDARADPD